MQHECHYIASTDHVLFFKEKKALLRNRVNWKLMTPKIKLLFFLLLIEG